MRRETLRTPYLCVALALSMAACGDEPAADPTVESDTVADTVPSDTSVDTPSADGTMDDGGPGDVTTDLGQDVADDALPRPETVADVASDGGDAADGSSEVSTDAEGDTAANDVSSGPCGNSCGADEVCAPGGNCVANCQQTDSSFEPQTVFASLGPGWDVIGMHCGGNLAVNAFEPLSAAVVLELVGVDGSPDSTLRVDKVAFDTEVTVANMSSSTIAGSIAAFEVFPGLRLKVDGAQESFGYGYTGLFDASLLFAPGQVLFGSLSNPGNPDAIEGSSNYDLAWVSDSNWLVSGRSVNSFGDSTAVYWLDRAESNSVVRAAEGLGFASGNVAVSGEAVLIGGYSDPWPETCASGSASGGQGNKVFYTTVTALQAAATSGQPVDAYCDAQEVPEIASDFSFLDDGNAISVNTFEQKLLTHHAVSIDSSGELIIAESTPIAIDDTLSMAKGVPNSDGQIMIKTAVGYMLIAPAL